MSDEQRHRLTLEHTARQQADRRHQESALAAGPHEDVAQMRERVDSARTRVDHDAAKQRTLADRQQLLQNELQNRIERAPSASARLDRQRDEDAARRFADRQQEQLGSLRDLKSRVLEEQAGVLGQRPGRSERHDASEQARPERSERSTNTQALTSRQQQEAAQLAREVGERLRVLDDHDTAVRAQMARDQASLAGILNGHTEGIQRDIALSQILKDQHDQRARLEQEVVERLASVHAPDAQHDASVRNQEPARVQELTRTGLRQAIDRAVAEARLATAQEVEKAFKNWNLDDAVTESTTPQSSRRAKSTAELREARETADRIRDERAQRLGLAESAGGQVHHAIELQVLKLYPGVFTGNELNSLVDVERRLENLRGIPPEVDGKKQLHNSKVREMWDRHYREIDNQIQARGLKTGTDEYNALVRQQVNDARKEIDFALGAFFSEQRQQLMWKAQALAWDAATAAEAVKERSRRT